MIIGRTAIGVENRSNISTLSKVQYFKLSHMTREFIIKNKIKALPVCLNDIVKNNNWKTISYSKLRNLKIRKFDTIMKLNSGFTVKTQNNQYIIFYDDNKPIPEQRFTISHEIGHILFNHFDIPIENREQEANMFAARLLMPLCILHECNIFSIKDLEIICNVSEMSAAFRFNRLCQLKKRNKFYTDSNEIKLKSLFASFINLKKAK